MPDSEAGLIVKRLSKQYATPSEPLVVVREVSFELHAGEAMTVTGPSGSGKSTLLYMLGALETPSSGSVRLDGRDPFALSADKLSEFRNRKIGFVFQDHHLLPQSTALENVLIPTLARGRPDGAERVEARARSLLERVGLGERLHHLPAELSGGERQRTAIARALIRRPPLILADEPTGNLDRRSADAVAELLLELQAEESAMMVVVTHSREFAERFERRAELIDGRLEPS